MGEIPAPPARHTRRGSEPPMSSPCAIITLAAFLALPLSLVYFMSHCNHFAPSSSQQHPHYTLQAQQSMLNNIGKLMAEASASPPNPQMQMRFCAGEDLKDCTAYKYDDGCTTVGEGRILSLSEPRVLEGGFSSCAVYRRGVQDCADEEEGSFKLVRDFLINWYMPHEENLYATNGVVPLLQQEWISDIGSFRCW